MFLSHPRTWCGEKSTDKEPATAPQPAPPARRTSCGGTRADALSTRCHGRGEELSAARAPAGGRRALQRPCLPLPARRAGHGGEGPAAARGCPGGVPGGGLGKAAQLRSLIPVGVCGSSLPALLGSCPGAGGIDRDCWKVEVTAGCSLPWAWEEKNKAVIKTAPP